jgi:hypothetical protein
MMILYGVAVTSTRCRFGFGYRNRKFPRKETGVYTQGNDSVYVRKQQFPRKGTAVSTQGNSSFHVRKPEYPPLETPVPKGRNDSTESRIE